MVRFGGREKMKNNSLEFVKERIIDGFTKMNLDVIVLKSIKNSRIK